MPLPYPPRATHRLAWLTLIAASSTAMAAEPHDAYRAITSQPEADYAWVERSLEQSPAFQSERVRYTIWVLADGETAMVTAWDESGGTGSGYDTFHYDQNGNGVLGEAGEIIQHDIAFDDNGKHAMTLFDATGITDSQGASYRLKMQMADGSYHWKSGFHVSLPASEQDGKRPGFKVGLLPGNLQIGYAHDLSEAPIYRLGGDALVLTSRQEGRGRNKKHITVLPGERYGRFTAGHKAGVSLSVGLVGGTLGEQLRFYHSKVGGQLPRILLRVLDANGERTEDIAFTGGCGCAGSFHQALLVPRRVPPGEHQLVIRLDRPEHLGGKAEFIYQVDVDNPDYGKALADPAFAALSERFPDSTIVSLRRAANAAQTMSGFPAEQVIATPVGDAALYGNTRDWNPSNHNFGDETLMKIGTPIHHRQASRGVVQVDLSGIPADTVIRGAYLRLTLSNERFTGSKADSKLIAHALRRDWNETGTDGHVCYNGPKIHGRGKGERWGKQGADDPESDRFPEVAATVDVSNFPNDERYRFVYADLTELVQRWHAGEIAYHGIVLKLEGGGVVAVQSSEFQDFVFRPTLLLACDGATPTAQTDATAGGALARAIEAAQSDGRPLLLKFYSPSCGVCMKADQTTFADATVQKTLSERYQYVSLKVEDHAELAERYGVGAIPAAVVLDSDGAEQQAILHSDVLLDKDAFIRALQ